MSELWRIRQFGAVAIEGPGFEGSCVAFETQRSAKILVILCVLRHGKIRREDLADLLWPDDFYDATRLRLRKELSRLRRTLGPAVAILTGEGDSIGLDRSKIDTDVDFLRRTVAMDDADPRREASLREAVTLASGPFLPQWEDPWAVAERSNAENLRCQALVGLSEILVAQNEPEAALATVRPAIEYDPCHESARMVAIRAHAALGSLAAAVGEFQQMKRLLRDRHDQAPSADAEALLIRVQEAAARKGSGTLPAETPGLPPLPVPLDRFFGRTEEMALLTEALSPSNSPRLVTLTGTGGIGKSRLALEFVLEHRSAFEGNVAFISLAESASREAVATTLLAHLGWQGVANADPVAVIASSLPPGPGLLVMDNLEHLLPDSANLVKRLLEACPTLKILATSRQPLRIAGETVVALGPLGGAAPEMLADLARSIRPGLDKDPDLAELAYRLDGIPLALRLAASRLRVLGPAALLQRLGDRFRLLQGDAPDLPLRHRSLQAALDGSFEALEERERETMLRMSPYCGGWTLGQLERALPEYDGLEAMESLVDASLVMLDDRGPSVRFTMLATVREYAVARSEDAEHLFVRAMSDELKRSIPHALSPRSFETLRALDAEADNLYAAFELANRLDPVAAADLLSRLWVYDSIRGRHREFDRRFRDLTQAHPDIPLAPMALLGIAVILVSLERGEEAWKYLEQAEKGYREAGDLACQTFTEASLIASQRRLLMSNLDDAIARFDAIVEKLRTVKPPNYLAALERMLLFQGSHLFYAGQLTEAAEALDQARLVAEQLQDDVAIVGAAQVRMYISLDLGLPELARKACQEIEPKIAEMGDPLRAAHHEEVLGRIAMQLDEPADALIHFQNSLTGWSRLRNEYQMADQENCAARALLLLNRLPEAVEYAREAMGHWRGCDDLGGVAVSLHTLAAIRLAQGDPAAAQTALSAAHCLTERHGLKFILSENQFMNALHLEAEPHPTNPEEIDPLFR